MIQVHRGQTLPDGLTSPDVYFTPGYGRAASETDHGEWLLLEAFDGAWQLPLIMRTLPDGTKDAISPYGYSGVYASPSLSPCQIGQAWSATVTCLQELGAISVLIRHSPLVPQAPHFAGRQWNISAHPTIVLEPADSDSAWRGLAGPCRNQIRKALKNGYTGDVRQASNEDLAPGGDFRGIYEETMRRLDAAPMYIFSDEYYAKLRDGLGSNLLIAEVRNQKGMVASSLLLMCHGQRLHGHLSGSRRDDARFGVNNLMIWTATQYAIDQGLDQYHLGGGLSPGDSLFRFKRTFGGRELEYNVCGLVINVGQYRARTESQARECGTNVDELVTSSYFPAYRGGPDSRPTCREIHAKPLDAALSAG